MFPVSLLSLLFGTTLETPTPEENRYVISSSERDASILHRLFLPPSSYVVRTPSRPPVPSISPEPVRLLKHGAEKLFCSLFPFRVCAAQFFIKSGTTKTGANSFAPMLPTKSKKGNPNAMSHNTQYNVRTQTESDAILILATDAMETKMNRGESFTALDISNALKARNFPVRHREVSAVVRGLYAGGGMTPFGYDRVLIPVTTAGGSEQAYLYQLCAAPDSYADDAQSALAPVPQTRARPLDDAVPAGAPLPGLAGIALAGMVGTAIIHGSGATASRRAQQPHTPRSAFRRDGAVAVPRKLIEQAGYQEGDLLLLTHDAKTGTLVLTPALAPVLTPVQTGVLGAFVRVWADLRVRIAQTKWRVAGYGGQVSPAQKPGFAVDNGRLRIAP